MVVPNHKSNYQIGGVVTNLYIFDINTDKNGVHEIHIEGCSKAPNQDNTIYIGYFCTPAQALTNAYFLHPHKYFDYCCHCCGY
ncbi:hypothetical protein WS9_010005 [Paraclostridium sordellii 8483]|uniref:hypothetical protein n=1 Tax=Paraclostridium sordellii TaxID=1505 RepID=UPI00107C5A53|nr:hypothetical protein [Paeniclostridium sordellii]TAN66637.1 hypothetical protein WS9_010005 [Paeniclostridium sordellii 8483]